jgi:N-acetyl-alpha-D-glucosaminyl L-malate synthase BshA
MNVGLLCFASVGGSGTVASGLAHELARLGHVVHVLAPTLPFRLGASAGDVRFHAVGATDALDHDGVASLACRIAGIAREARLDVLHVHYADARVVAACRARALLDDEQPLAVVTTLHGTDVTAFGTDAADRDDIRTALHRSDRVLAVSHALATTAQHVFGIDAPTVIPNFVDLAEFRPRERRARDAAYERRIVHVSTFRAVKRTADCLLVFARIVRQVPCRLLMVGDGPEAAAARALSEQLGVAAHVEFVGVQARISEFVAEADLLLLPSASESFGLAALEAMSCGVPVVASRVGGLPEVVEDVVCGRLLPVGDVSGMAAAALEILGDPRTAAAMGAAGRRIAEQRFDARQVVPRYAELYREVVAGGTARPRS